MINRRFFIGGASAFGSLALFGDRRVLTASDRPSGKPNLRLGVISDIHIDRLAKPGEKEFPGRFEITFQKALEWFRDMKADAVVLTGDMADWGYGEGLLDTMTTWERVFPNDRAPDGRKVERLFIYGNHECYTSLVPYAKRFYPDEGEWAKHSIRADMAGWWKKAFHEDYRRFYEKEVKGYRFLGCHWDCWTAPGDPHSQIEAYMKEKGKTIDPSRPFFYLQHPALKDTCNGPWAWDHDYGVATRVLSAFPKAVAISGDTHYSLTDERSVWQGAFTSVCAGSLCYTGHAHDSCPPNGYENAGCPAGKDASKIDAAKMMPAMDTGDCRQGMFWEVYDDTIVMKRREFISGQSLGPDWVVPIASPSNRPFAFVEHARKIEPPQFPFGAKVTCERIRQKNRKGQEKDAVRVSVPPVRANVRGRCFEMVFAAQGEKTPLPVRKVVMAEGFNQPLGSSRAKSPTSCVFAADELPPGRVTFTVTPRNCFGAEGKSIVLKCPR